MNSPPIVCPLCPLHCDDLSAAVLSTQCRTFADLWHRQQQVISQQQGFDDSSLLLTARSWLDAAASIVISGQVTDLATARSVCRLVQRTGASLQCPQLSADGFAEAFARDGMISCTLAEAASPHQQVIVIGDPFAAYPRLQQRLATAGSQYRWQRDDQLADRLARLHWQLSQRQSKGSSTAAVPELLANDADLRHCWQLCQSASSLVWLVGPLSLSTGDQRAFWRSMQRLQSDLNGRIRSSLLRLDPASTLRNVVAWSGTSLPPAMAVEPLSYDLEIHLVAPPHAAATNPPAVSLGKRRVLIDAYGFVADRSRLDSSQPDVSTIGDDTLRLPAVAVGLSAAGVVIRGDGSVTLPLAQLLPSPLPTAAQWIDRFLAIDTLSGIAQ